MIKICCKFVSLYWSLAIICQLIN